MVAFLRGRASIRLFCPHVPRPGGIEGPEKNNASDPGAEVILMTAHYSTDSAVEAIQKGACDYMNKPMKLEKLRARITQLLDLAQQRRKAMALEHELMETYQLEGMIVRSPLVLDVFARILRVAPHFRTALVTGATGTGKELAARALHRHSPVSAA